jgi:anti-sigma factor RsiW
MSCLRFDLHRQLPLYLDGAASPRTVERIERHLLDCSSCRASLLRMREAKGLLSALPKLEPPVWGPASAGRPLATPQTKHTAAGTFRFIRHFAADALVASALFAAFTLLYTHTASARIRTFDSSSFRSVRVNDVAATDDPHVVVEGVVSELKGDFKEGSHRFRLSDGKASVVCEILDGDPLKAPKPGSRVRVWGVSRYDASPDHRWFEIHPVLKVEVVR